MSIGVHRLNRVPTKKIRFKGKKITQTKNINRKKSYCQQRLFLKLLCTVAIICMMLITI